jgi:hypothetical protein
MHDPPEASPPMRGILRTIGGLGLPRATQSFEDPGNLWSRTVDGEQKHPRKRALSTFVFLIALAT